MTDGMGPPESRGRFGPEGEPDGTLPLVFEVKLARHDLQAENLPAHRLAEIITGVEKTLSAIVLEQCPDIDPRDLIIGLSEVREGSTRLLFRSSRPKQVCAAFLFFTTVVSSGDFERLPPDASRAVAPMTKLATEWDCPINFQPPQTAEEQAEDVEREPLAVLQPGVSVPSVESISGETVLYGRLTRVGGETPKARLKLAGPHAVNCTLDESLARTVASRLYDVVGLRGYATWVLPTLELSSFRAEELLPFEETGIADAFGELRTLGANLWEGVADVPALVAELRGEDGPWT